MSDRIPDQLPEVERTSPEPWPEPQVTPNSMLLSGYIIGALAAQAQERWITYRLIDCDLRAGTQVVERTETGNRYLIKVEQISGEE